MNITDRYREWVYSQHDCDSETRQIIFAQNSEIERLRRQVEVARACLLYGKEQSTDWLTANKCAKALREMERRDGQI